MLSAVASNLGITAIESGGSDYITFRMERGGERDLVSNLISYFNSSGSTELLVSDKELPLFEKYDEYVPAELLRKAFLADRLDIKETLLRIEEIKKEYFE